VLQTVQLGQIRRGFSAAADSAAAPAAAAAEVAKPVIEKRSFYSHCKKGEDDGSLTTVTSYHIGFVKCSNSYLCRYFSCLINKFFSGAGSLRFLRDSYLGTPLAVSLSQAIGVRRAADSLRLGVSESPSEAKTLAAKS
jgi:hypothetical protein